MPIKLYGVAVSGNVNPVVALCFENGIPYEVYATTPGTMETKTAEFRKLNPMHCVPTINDEGFTM